MQKTYSGQRNVQVFSKLSAVLLFPIILTLVIVSLFDYVYFISILNSKSNIF